MKTTMKKLAAYLLALLLVLQIVPALAGNEQIISNTQGSISEDAFRDKLAVTTDTAVLEVGMTVKLETTEGYDKITWTSDNPEIASVENGVVTAKSAGQVKITAEQDGYSDSVTLKVIGTADVAGDSSESEKMIIIITGKKDKVQYNGEVQTNTYTATSKNPDFNPDNLRLKDETALASATDCGVYMDTMTEASFEYEGADAEFVVTNGWLQIKPVSVTVKADDATQRGDEKPEFSATVTGLIEGDDPSLIQYTFEVFTSGDVTYIAPVCESLQGNYRVTAQPGILTIEDGAYRAIMLTSDWPAGEPAYAGTIITMTAELIGFENVDYTLQWQYSTDNKEWTDIPGANDISYTFELNETTCMNTWRVVANY